MNENERKKEKEDECKWLTNFAGKERAKRLHPVFFEFWWRTMTSSRSGVFAYFCLLLETLKITCAGRRTQQFPHSGRVRVGDERRDR